MNKFKALATLLVSTGVLLSSHSTLAADNWIGMVTGSKTGTYIKIGQDIADSASKSGVEIQVKESLGSLDNIKRMNSKENAGFGIVQSDVLGYMQKSDSPELRSVASKLRMVFPLYNEEVHIFANRSINSLKDLNGRTVSVGEEGGGSWMTAVNLFNIAGVTPSKTYNWDKTKAAAAVLDGKLDAMIYVAGKPVTFFEKVGMLKNDPSYAERFNQVHFVEVNDPKVLQEYAASSISSQDYQWLEGGVDAVAVKAVMVSYDFSSRRNGYYAMRCDQLGKISQSLHNNLATLKNSGRTAKWNEVDLGASIGQWPKDECSRSSSPSATTTEQKLKSFFN